MDQLRSHDDRHTVLELEIQFFKEKLRQNHAEMSLLRRSICLFVERFDQRLNQEVRQRQQIKGALFTLMQEVRECIDRFLEHDVGN